MRRVATLLLLAAALSVSCPGWAGARERSDDAATSAAMSTTGFVIGGAGLAAGAILWAVAATQGSDDDASQATSGVELVPVVGVDAGVVLVRLRY